MKEIINRKDGTYRTLITRLDIDHDDGCGEWPTAGIIMVNDENCPCCGYDVGTIINLSYEEEQLIKKIGFTGKPPYCVDLTISEGKISNIIWHQI